MALLDELRTVASDVAAARAGLSAHLSAARDREEAVESLARDLWRDARPLDLPILRAFVELETEFRREEDGCGDALLAACHLLYRLGEPEDVFLLFAAKYANMDCGCMLDHDLLTMGRGRDEMLDLVTKRLEVDPSLRAYRRRIDHAVADAFAHPNYDSPDALRSSYDRYFAEWSKR